MPEVKIREIEPAMKEVKSEKKKASSPEEELEDRARLVDITTWATSAHMPTMILENKLPQGSPSISEQNAAQNTRQEPQAQEFSAYAVQRITDDARRRSYSSAESTQRMTSLLPEQQISQRSPGVFNHSTSSAHIHDDREDLKYHERRGIESARPKHRLPWEI